MQGLTHREIFRNELVAVMELAVPPGETESMHTHGNYVSVQMTDATVEVTEEGSAPRKVELHRGDVLFRMPLRHMVKNVGATEIRAIRIDFLGPGRPGDALWGNVGLSPNYKVLFENQFARAYDIRIPAGTKEPQHTHRDRVVVCLSGAELRHLLPDGRTEVSTLQTNEVAWRRGSTHIGQNLGRTDLWVIAIEPK
ncbi:MAG: hypothetical protein HY238_28515 [Acidobacteria bacterium]|nr:hypothetical protein [Acidobacteriota bacterium]